MSFNTPLSIPYYLTELAPLLAAAVDGTRRPRVREGRFVMPTPAETRYCEVVFELAEDDIDVVQARVAERLSVSRPAVSEMIDRLERVGLVLVEGRQLRLTESGIELAESAVRRHRLAERFLVDVLALGWAEAHELAQKWQEVIDDRTEPALSRILGDPETCPHGNPIPGRGATDPEAVSLAVLGVGGVGLVVRVTEQLEADPGMLLSLERAGLIPGTQVHVQDVSADGAIAVRASLHTLPMSAATARCILVRPGDLSAVSDEVSRGSR